MKRVHREPPVIDPKEAWAKAKAIMAKRLPERIRKRRRQRKDLDVEMKVRGDVMTRDGVCRLAFVVGEFRFRIGRCEGVSEFAHLGEFRRFKTRGMLPEERHNTPGTMSLCTKHHRLYDAHTMNIEALTEDGADGAMRFTVGDVVFEERDR